MTGQRSGDDAEPLLAPGAAGPSRTAVPLPDTDSDGGSERGSRSSALPASGSRTLRAGGGGSGGVGGDNPFPFPSPFRLYDGLPLWRRYPLPSACVVIFGALVVLWLLVGLLSGGGASSDTLGLGKLGVASAGSSDPGTLAMIAELLKARNASQPPIPIPELFDRVDGYFTLFRGTGLAQGRVLLEVPASELDKPFIITAMYGAGDSGTMDVTLLGARGGSVSRNVVCRCVYDQGRCGYFGMEGVWVRGRCLVGRLDGRAAELLTCRPRRHADRRTSWSLFFSFFPCQFCFSWSGRRTTPPPPCNPFQRLR